MSLVTSSAFGRRCPVCGAPNHECGGPSNSVAADKRIVEARDEGGPLVRVPIGRGVSVLVRVAQAPATKAEDAPPQDKAEQPARNKRRRVSHNKAAGR